MLSIIMLAVAIGGCARDVVLSKTLPDRQQQVIPLRILTYNVHLLPDIAVSIAGKRSEPDYRARSIAKQLVDYDIIGICEAFDRNHSQTLIDAFHANTSTQFFVAKGPERSGRHFIGSGLVLMSRFPVEKTHTITYQNSSQFLTSGLKADEFAAKGALHARIRLDDDSRAVIDCFLTHLESQSKRARESQIEELADFIALYSTDENPVVIFGDFNVASDDPQVIGKPGNGSPYETLRSSLSRNGLKLVDVGCTFSPELIGTSDPLADDGGQRIDYIFVSDARANSNVFLEPKESLNLPMLDDKVPEGSLSDHRAITCRAEFHWTAESSNDADSFGE